MPCRVTAKRRQKKDENRPLFAFCAVLPAEQKNTQPALQTLLTNGKSHLSYVAFDSEYQPAPHVDGNCSNF